MTQKHKQYKVLLKGALHGWAAFRDPLFLLALSAGFIAWLLPSPGMSLPWPRLLGLAFLEELVFRFLVQESLSRAFADRHLAPGLSWANLVTSSLFALLHLVSHPPLWALSVFLPSLVFGWAWDRYRNLIPCWALHFAYNLLYFHRV